MFNKILLTKILKGGNIMLELKANYYCRVCGHTETGINIDNCLKCGSEEILPAVNTKDLRILPKVFEMAELANISDYQNVLSQVSFAQACGIMNEAIQLLLLLKKRDKTKMNDFETVIIEYGEEIGEIAKAISTLKKYP